MPAYEVHVGLELPFWLELREGAIEISESGRVHHFNLSNDVHRLDVGDFFLGQGNLSRRWVPSEYAEHTRAQLQELNPDIPITRHASKTVLTHVRDVECEGDEGVARAYDVMRVRWYEETLRLTNRLIETYMLLAGHEGDAGPVASWDVGYVIVSFWRSEPDGTPVQVGGMQLLVRDESPPPLPMEQEREALIRIALRDEVQLSLIDQLHSGARAQIVRGRYRHAIADAVSAFEIQIARGVEERLVHVLPRDIVDDLIRQRFDDLCGWLVKLGGPDVKRAPEWPAAVNARKLRQDILHWGAGASKVDAESAHAATGAIINLVKRSVAGPPPPA